MKKVRVTLKKSLIRKKKKISTTARSLGLTKIGTTREFPYDDAVKGKLFTIKHMVDMEIIESGGKKNETAQSKDK